MCIQYIQTTIAVEFKPIESISDYELQWKSIEKQWDNNNLSSCAVKADNSKTCKTEAYDLDPGMTYCVRLVCTVDGTKGSPCKELIIDTEQVGCGPKKKKSGCLIQ